MAPYPYDFRRYFSMILFPLNSDEHPKNVMAGDAFSIHGFFTAITCDTISRMNFSPITDDLFIGTTPSAEDYNHLRGLGVRLVINMRVEYRPRKDPHPTPLELLWLPTFDSPLVPIPMRALHRGAKTALAAIQNGGKVYAHCAGGVHRGVTMGACILIAQGYTPQAAMELIKAKRLLADPFVFYIRSRILKFANQLSESNP